MEDQDAMTQGKSLGECWETVGIEDYRVKCDDAEDHRVKEELIV